MSFSDITNHLFLTPRTNHLFFRAVPSTDPTVIAIFTVKSSSDYFNESFFSHILLTTASEFLRLGIEAIPTDRFRKRHSADPLLCDSGRSITMFASSTID